MLTLDYLCPKDVVFSANIKDSKNKKINNYTFIQRSKDGIQLLVNVPDEKKYTLTVYAKNMNDEGNYSGLAEYNLIGDVGDKRKVRTFPMQYGEFNKNNGKLSSPLKGTLKLNQNYVFLLEMDNVSEMSIIHNNKWTRFEKNNLNQFILDKVFESAGKVKITAKIGNGDSFSSILVYEIM